MSELREKQNRFARMYAQLILYAQELGYTLALAD